MMGVVIICSGNGDSAAALFAVVVDVAAVPDDAGEGTGDANMSTDVVMDTEGSNMDVAAVPDDAGEGTGDDNMGIGAAEGRRMKGTMKRGLRSASAASSSFRRVISNALACE